jgi:hypothetical protein
MVNNARCMYVHLLVTIRQQQSISEISFEQRAKPLKCASRFPEAPQEAYDSYKTPPTTK